MRGKVALITGSTEGLGLALAESLAASGCHIMLTGLAARADMVELIATMAKTHGVKVAYCPADLRQPAEIDALMAETVATLGSVDILINNAVLRRFATVEHLPPDAWDDALAVNLSAAYHTIRLALPAMRQKGWGRIINLASVYSSIALPGRIDYVTTKHALVGLTRTVGLELADSDITCNAIAPGLIKTKATETRIAALAAEKGIDLDAATREFLSTRQPGGKFIPMETVTALAVFLCGPTSAGINGALLPVDNGWSIA